VILVEKNPVVVLATSVTAASGVGAVLSNAAMTGRHVSTLLAVVGETGRLTSQGQNGKHHATKTEATKR